MVNASVSKKLRGTLNGLIMVAGSLGHGVGPIAGSVLYAVLTKAKQVTNHICIYVCMYLEGMILFHFTIVLEVIELSFLILSGQSSG